MVEHAAKARSSSWTRIKRTLQNSTAVNEQSLTKLETIGVDTDLCQTTSTALAPVAILTCCGT
jgi:hypothetical protein